MTAERNIQIEGRHGKPILLDIFLPADIGPSVVILSHGFKGFKDWGHFNWVAEQFALAGFAFVKFNFSHNGTTPEYPEDFADLEAFGNNNYSIELDDLGAVIDWVEDDGRVDVKRLYLLGHSRGGGITILKANEDARVKRMVTWASVGEFGSGMRDFEIEAWAESGVHYIRNARTKQQMPIYYQFYENYQQNEQRLNISNAVRNIDIPHLIMHGTEDDPVPVEEGQRMKMLNPEAELILVHGAGHTFGAKHPYDGGDLPDHVHLVMEETIDFLKN